MQRNKQDSEPLSACPAVENPLTALARLYQEQLQICSRLEEVADSLGGQIDLRMCQEVATDIRRSMAFLHRFEEDVLHPMLTGSDEPTNRRTFQRLSEEHFTDQGYAEEIIELLTALRRGASEVDIERAGYMLRGFFETVRRHTVFEIEHVLQQARDRLSATDLEKLGEQLEAHRMMAPVACTVTRVKIRSRRRV